MGKLARFSRSNEHEAEVENVLFMTFLGFTPSKRQGENAQRNVAGK